MGPFSEIIKHGISGFTSETIEGGEFILQITPLIGMYLEALTLPDCM